MKKLFYLAASALILSSCLDDGNFGGGGGGAMSEGILIHNAVINQTTAALDPFNVAFRFNTLLTECGGDLNRIQDDQSLKDMQDALLGSNVRITSSENQIGERVYTLNLNGGLNGKLDMKRSGRIEIRTTSLYLNDNGSVWTLSIPEGAPYSIFPQNTASNSVEISAQMYQIRNNGTNRWDISISALYATPKSTVSTDGTRSEWSGSYTITQNGGTQSYADIASTNRIYDVSFQASGKPMNLFSVAIETKTELPLQYNANCQNKAIVGEGKLTAWLKDDPMAIVTSQWLGEDKTDCTPKIRLTWNDMTEEYETE